MTASSGALSAAVLSALLLVGCADRAPVEPTLDMPAPAQWRLDQNRLSGLSVMLDDANRRLVPELGAGAPSSALSALFEQLRTAAASGDVRTYSTALTDAERLVMEFGARATPDLAPELEALHQHLSEARAVLVER